MCGEMFWVIESSRRANCEECVPRDGMGESHKNKMTDGRKRALKDGNYQKEYERKSREMRGKPHGHDDKIQAGHLKMEDRHPSARHHSLISPAGESFVFDNAEFFVRSNPDLFLDVDILVRRRPNGKRFTRAGNGLQAVSNGNKKSWKGWLKDC